MLLADLLGTDRGGLLVRRRDPLNPDLADAMEQRLRLRGARVPLQHILGVQEFHGLEFRVDSRVLIPRPETEGIVDAALDLDLPQAGQVADLGTGSGCLAITLAVRRPGLGLHALDLSAAALQVARENARRHGVEERIEFVEGDLGEPPPAWQGRMDLVVSNPPYVAEGEWADLQPEVRDHDPRQALVAGPSGLETLQRLIPAAHALLRPGAWLAVEIGLGQAEAVTALAQERGFAEVEFRDDFQRIPRVLLARRRESDR